jgi:hypothetical protein
MSSAPTHGLVSAPPGADRPDAQLKDVLRPSRKLVAVLSGIALALGATLFVVLPRPHADAVSAVNTSPTLERAQRLGVLPVFVPTPLPAGWVADSVHLDAKPGRAHLHIGYRAPDNNAVGLEEMSASPRRALVSQITEGGGYKGNIELNGQTWQWLQSGRRSLPSLIWVSPRGVVIVTGTTTLATIEQLAASLPVAP